MKIFVDADACPVVRIVEEVAEKYRIDVTLLCDTNHILTSDYSEVIVVGAGADAVDYKLISPESVKLRCFISRISSYAIFKINHGFIKNRSYKFTSLL